MTYNPWLDAQQRYPHMHIEWWPIAPYHAMVAPRHGVIFVDEHISRAERRCALAHELAHMDSGDSETERCWFATRQETEADKLACRRLIDAHDLAEVVRWTQNGTEAAAELGVTVAFLQLRWTWMTEWERALSWRSISMRESVA